MIKMGHNNKELRIATFKEGEIVGDNNFITG